MDLQWIVATMVGQFPIVIVCAAGIVWALLRLDRQPRAALFVLAGLGIYVVLGIAQIFLQGPLNSMLSQVFGQNAGMGNMRMSFAVTGFAFNVARAVSLGLLAFAAFVDRPGVAMSPPPHQPMR